MLGGDAPVAKHGWSSWCIALRRARHQKRRRGDGEESLDEHDGDERNDEQVHDDDVFVTEDQEQ
jgi:hypothetical protein